MIVVTRVGLVLYIDLSRGICAVLQRRGETDFEKNWNPESWPGGLQVTAHGGRHPDEDETDALLRECEEELGTECAAHVEQNQGGLQELSGSDDPSKTFGLFVPYTIIPEIRLHPSSGGLKLVTHADVKCMRPLQDFPRDRVLPPNVLAMHKDEIDAVLRGFGLFS